MADHTLDIGTVAIIESLSPHEKKTGKMLCYPIQAHERDATYLPVENYRAEFFMRDAYPENMAECCPTHEDLVEKPEKPSPAD